MSHQQLPTQNLRLLSHLLSIESPEHFYCTLKSAPFLPHHSFCVLSFLWRVRDHCKQFQDAKLSLYSETNEPGSDKPFFTSRFKAIILWLLRLGKQVIKNNLV